MRIILLSICVLFAVAIQATLLVMINLPFHLTPDLVLIMTISYGLLRGPDEGLMFGAVSGLLVDFLAGGLIGIGALSKIIVGFLAGLLEKTIFKDNLLVPALATFVGSIFVGSFDTLMQIAFNANYHFGFTLFSMILPLAVYNSICAPMVYLVFLKMERFLLERTNNL